jgi:aspartate beta-hydroxylase
MSINTLARTLRQECIDGRVEPRTPIYDRASGLVRKVYEKRIEGPPVLDLDANFPNARMFAAAWREIRDEALAIAGRLESVPRLHEIMREQASISCFDDRDWRVFILKAYGVESPRNMARCPTLSSVLRRTPEVASATLSFLAPGKHIPRHRGWLRCVLRFHLGLSMPSAQDGRPAAVLKIGDCEHRISNGECLLWDDTYPHEVWNDSDEVRIALLLDVWRPGMPIDMELFSRLLAAIVRMCVRCRGVPFGS